MTKKNDAMTAKVAARVEAERANQRQKGEGKPVAVRSLEITDDELWAYLRENRVGDAKLYCRLHRGRVVYLRHWERWLLWQGHHSYSNGGYAYVNYGAVLEDGRPAGWGTHEELLASCGAYQETSDSQYPGEREKRGFAAEGVTA